MSQLFEPGGQSIEASASVLPTNVQDWVGFTSLISLQSKELSRVFSNTTFQKHQFLGSPLSLHPTLTSIHDYWKTIALTRWTFVGKVMSLLFNMLSRFVIAFLPRSKCLNFMTAVTNPQWFWSPRKENLSLFPLFPHRFAMKWWDWMPWA